MLTTGAVQAEGALLGGSRPTDESRLAVEQDVAARTLALVPTDCPVCGDVEAEPVAVCEDFGVPATAEALLALRCSDCGCVYLSPAPAPARASVASSGFISRPGPIGAARRLAGLARGLDETRVLDFRGKSDDPGSLGHLPTGHYELVILDGALEYVHAPLALLADARRVLQPRGHVALVLNNLGSPSFTAFGGRHWAGYDFPRQRGLYSLEAMHRLAARAGFEVSSISSVANTACWVESSRRALVDWRAPAWLVRRFTTTSVASHFVFAALEQILRWRGRGASLVVILTAK